MATIEKDLANPHGTIVASDFTSPSEVTDGAALQLTVQDAETTESWMQNNYWVLRWREADALYQSPPGIMMWEGTTVPRSNVNRFVVAETVNAIHPQVMNGLFYENPSFVLRPRPNEDQNTTRAISALLAVQLDQAEVRNEVDWGLFSALNFGTGIWKWGYKSYVKKVKKYVRLEQPMTLQRGLPGSKPETLETPKSTQFRLIEVDEEIHQPTFENVDIRHMLVDPGCQVPDIRKAKFVIHRMYLTYKDLIALKDEEYVVIDANGKQSLKKRYDLPDEATIKSWFEKPRQEALIPASNVTFAQSTTFVHHSKPQFESTTKDPLNEPLEVLERWDNDKVITVIQRVKTIRNEPNEFGCIPFLSCNWWNIPASFWGIGLGRAIGVEQRVQAGLINAVLDLASLIVNPQWIRARGQNTQEQQIRQRIGGIITVDVPQGGRLSEQLQMVQQPVIPGEILNQIAMSEHRVEQTSGANQQLTMGAGGSGKGSGGQMGRSGTGAAGIIQATMNRIGGFAEMFIRQVFEPLLYAMHQMNKDKTPMDYVQQVLGDKLGQNFKFDPADFMTATAEFEVLAGSHLAAKSQMAQSLFMMMQIFENKPILDQIISAGKIVDVEELLHMIHDLSGWKNYYNIVRDQTDEEKERIKSQSDAALQQSKGAMAMQQQQQKFSNDQQIIDQENEARITRDVFRHIAETSVMPEALSGQPPTQGVGSQEGA